MIKILAVDMDGTCLDSNGQMAPETLQALKTAAEKGVLVVPTTGRNVNCLPKALKNQDFYRYIISSNGSKSPESSLNSAKSRRYKISCAV